MDPDAELLVRVNEKRDFFGAVCADTLNDWNLAKTFGEFLVRILPESEVMGHAILVRAHRHLGNTEAAFSELEQSKKRMANRTLAPWETQMLVPMLEDEERKLLRRRG